MLRQQRPQGLQVYETDVVHLAVDLTDVYAEEGQLVPVQGVLQEPQVHLHLELRLQHDTHKDEVLPARPAVVLGDLLDRGDDLVDRKVLEDATQPRDTSRHEIPPLAIVGLLVTVELGQGVHDVMCVIVVVDHVEVFVEDGVCYLEGAEDYLVELGTHHYQTDVPLLVLAYDLPLREADVLRLGGRHSRVTLYLLPGTGTRTVTLPACFVGLD